MTLLTYTYTEETTLMKKTNAEETSLMKKAMISQPMNGLTEEKVRVNTERLTAILNNMGYEVVESYIKEEPPSSVKNPSLWYLAKSLEILSSCDLLYLSKDWEHARGCIVERDCAKQYDIFTIEEGKEHLLGAVR